jgi:CRISPR-associated protein Csd1
MILQELCRHYDRLAADPEADVAPLGNVVQGVAFAVVIDESGKLVNIQDLRDPDGNTKRNKQMILPGKAKPSGAGMNPSLHGWDRTDYMLGYLDPDAFDPGEKVS